MKVFGEDKYSYRFTLRIQYFVYILPPMGRGKCVVGVDGAVDKTTALKDHWVNMLEREGSAVADIVGGCVLIGERAMLSSNSHVGFSPAGFRRFGGRMRRYR